MLLIFKIKLSLEKSSVDTATTFIGNFQSWNLWKKNLKENNVILSIDFSWNYENKQLYKVQSAYFGHENFTLYTAVCYHKSLGIDSKSDPNDLTVINMVITSNETCHNRNVAFTNNKFISIVREIAPTTDKFHFSNDGCAGQSRSRYVFWSFGAYPADIKLTWGYVEAHNFKGMLIMHKMVR